MKSAADDFWRRWFGIEAAFVPRADAEIRRRWPDVTSADALVLVSISARTVSAASNSP
jgi:hypothetical protein